MEEKFLRQMLTRRRLKTSSITSPVLQVTEATIAGADIRRKPEPFYTFGSLLPPNYNLLEGDKFPHLGCFPHPSHICSRPINTVYSFDPDTLEIIVLLASYAGR
jgi:hypothetical protein